MEIFKKVWRVKKVNMFKSFLLSETLILKLLCSLEELYANNIGIREICFDDCDHKANGKTSFFPKLHSLSLNENEINDVRKKDHYI